VSTRTGADRSAVRSETTTRLEQEVGRLLRRVRRVIHERARAVHPDLQPAAYLLLGHLAGTGPSRSTALVEAVGIDKGAVSRQVQHLTELGLVERSPDPDDGRATLLSATEDARRRLDEVAVQRRRQLAERLVGWTDQELSSLVDELARYNATLE
jgi:DNA-binding MarR family transcriptional regulator